MSFPARAPLQLRASIALVLALAAFALLAWPASAQQPDLPSEPPARPTGLTLDVSHDLVALTWDDPGDASITHYEVFRRDRDVHASGEFISITANTGSASTSYTDNTAQPLHRYRYRIKAVNQHGASQWSRFAGAETPEAPIEDHQRDPAPITRDEGSAAVAAVACPDRDTEPTPQSVEVTAVPIVVTSTTAEYFVLYVSHDLDGTELEIPVLLKSGEAGATTLAENVEALPKERYRVEKYLIADPADIDGDCIDDITELDSLGSMNPYNPAPAIETSDGALAIQDRAAFELYAHAASHGSLILKYIIFAMDSGRLSVYFQNTKTYPHHVEFLESIGLTEPTVSRGVIVYDPALVTPDGRPGVYYYPNNRASNSFGEAALIHTVTAASIPLLDHNLALHLPTNQLLELQAELPTIQELPYPSYVRRRHTPRHQLPGIALGGRVWLSAGRRPGRAAPPARHRALRGTAQRTAPRGRHHQRRAPDATVARQPAGHPERHPQRLHPRRPRQPCHRAPDQWLRPLRGDRRRLDAAGGHQGGSRCPLRVIPTRSPDAAARPVGHRDQPPH